MGIFEIIALIFGIAAISTVLVLSYIIAITQKSDTSDKDNSNRKV